MELLERGLRGPLTLVSAPAGFGKTTLIAEWRARPAPPRAQRSPASSADPIGPPRSPGERSEAPGAGPPALLSRGRAGGQKLPGGLANATDLPTPTAAPPTERTLDLAWLSLDETD